MNAMTNTVLLDNVSHKDLSVRTDQGVDPGHRVNQILVFPTEFADLQREYPILFRKEADGYKAIALLGLDRDENLFLDDDGWTSEYLPAVLARGPFLIGMQERQQDGQTAREPMIQVNLDDPRVDISGQEGEPVFLPKGGHGPYLERVAHMLGVIHNGLEQGPQMYAAFDAAGLFEPVAIEIRLDDETAYRLPDFHTISEEKLAALNAKTLKTLNASGFLGAAFLVAASLGNVTRLIARKNQKRARG